MNAIIGYTGFVGSNINKQMRFDKKYNSQNIESIKNKKFDLVVCAGVSGTKYLANKFPEKDFEMIMRLIKSLDTITATKFILISTVDVYKEPYDVNENSELDGKGLHHYGKNRLYLEKWVENKFDNYSIIRLPALFGNGLKKNFLYDMINKAPPIILLDKFNELSKEIGYNELGSYYTYDGISCYKLKNLSIEQKKNLNTLLKSYNFSSNMFTDARSKFQFYYLDNIVEHINIIIKNNPKIVNVCTEPISAKEVSEKCFDSQFENIITDRKPLNYNIKTIYYRLFGGSNGYIYGKNQVLNQIKFFIRNNNEF